MLSKELMFHARRFMQTNPGEKVHLVEAPLILAFWFRTSRCDSSELVSRYNKVCAVLERYCSAMLNNKLLIGQTQSAPGDAPHYRLQSEADAASLGEDLLRRLCPPLLDPMSVSIEKLNVAFGVYEKATCFPRREAIREYSYHVPIKQLEDSHAPLAP